MINACILDKHNNSFAVYNKNANDTFHFVFPAEPINATEFADKNLLVFNRIINNKDTLGTVCLRVQLDELQKIKDTQYTVAIILLIVGVGLSFLIAFIVQRYISRRLLYLVNMMQQSSRTDNYNTRVIEDGRDEISTLLQVFNNLMSQIVENHRRKMNLLVLPAMN
ncbi:MAG: HAMP domain-containing protein [Bacteroidota bacterium]|nr:HAMP domain-containing protein [Bacteroidota bacterium]